MRSLFLDTALLPGGWARNVALEVEGGVWQQGRHTRGSGFVKDMEKYSEGAILGWCILRVTPQDVRSGRAASLVKRALDARGRYVPYVEEPATPSTPDAASARPRRGGPGGRKTWTEKGNVRERGVEPTPKK